MNDIVYEEQKQLIKIWKDKYDEKKKEIERLHSIIKEVREYIENNKQWYDKELGLVEIEGYKSNRIPIVYLYGLLQILDKVEEDK